MSCKVYAIHPAHSESPGCIVLVSIVCTVCGFQVVSKNPRNRNPFGLIVACVYRPAPMAICLFIQDAISYE